MRELGLIAVYTFDQGQIYQKRVCTNSLLLLLSTLTKYGLFKRFATRISHVATAYIWSVTRGVGEKKMNWKHTDFIKCIYFTSQHLAQWIASLVWYRECENQLKASLFRDLLWHETDDGINTAFEDDNLCKSCSYELGWR